jgi:hypothetical protein
MRIQKLRYDVDYKGLLGARIDWVGGGNFDGYIYRVCLRFLKENNRVVRTIKIVDDSRYDGEAYTAENYGTFSETDKATITCIFPEFQMRGKILGERNQYIAFSIFTPQRNIDVVECYEWNTC